MVILKITIKLTNRAQNLTILTQIIQYFAFLLSGHFIIFLII